MEWNLDVELTDQIIFAMENEDTLFYLDSHTGKILEENQVKGTEIGRRYYQLPQWRSFEGFQLMEKFVGTIRNPLFREELRQTLTSGHGVFRAFKDVLKSRKELEKLWFTYKKREMMSVVREWLADLQEIEGLEKLALPDEETEELIFSDFAFSRNIDAHLKQITDLDREVFFSAYSQFPLDEVDKYYTNMRSKQPGLTEDKSLVLVVETPGGHFAGFAWGVEITSLPQNSVTIELMQLALVQEFQDLGLGKALLKSFINLASETGASTVKIRLPRSFLSGTRLFEREGFQISEQVMELDLTHWEQNSD